MQLQEDYGEQRDHRISNLEKGVTEMQMTYMER